MSDTKLPVEPPPDLIEGMCRTFRHDFGLVRPEGRGAMHGSGMTEVEREGLRATMRQLWQHDIRPYLVRAAGHGAG